VDSKELNEAFTNAHKEGHKKLLSALTEMAEPDAQFKEILQMESDRGPQTAATDSETAVYKQLMSIYGIKENAKPKMSSEIARLIGEQEAFRPLFKICSKVMHRTALSIASTNAEGGLDEILPFLFSSAVGDLSEIYGAIDRQVQRNGIHPPAA